MRRRVAIIACLVLVLVMLAFATGLLNLDQFRSTQGLLSAHRTDYTRLAKSVLAQDPKTNEWGLARFRIPSSTRQLSVRRDGYVLRQGGHFFVYFILSDQTTTSIGLAYSQDGSRPTPGNFVEGSDRLERNWYAIGVNNAQLETLY